MLFNGWKVLYVEVYNSRKSIEKWLDSLSKIQFKAVAYELELLRRCGNELGLPHSKSLGAGLLELRERRFGVNQIGGV